MLVHRLRLATGLVLFAYVTLHLTNHALGNLSLEAMERDAALLAATRPTAVNLRWALDRMLTRLRNTRPNGRVAAAYAEVPP